MGTTNQRQNPRPETSVFDPNIPSSSSFSSNKKKWSNVLPIFVGLVVFGEIAFLCRLDMAKNVDIVNTWADSFYQFTKSTTSSWSAVSFADEAWLGLDGIGLDDPASRPEDGCEAWLEEADSVPYSRDFKKEPIFVNGGSEEWKSCAVGCNFGYRSDKKPDAAFGFFNMCIWHDGGKGYDVVMTTSLSSDVPVGYFSWAEYDIMAPVQPKTESALAAAFISNCAARNFRLQALTALEKSDVKIDSYGGCHRNRNGRVDKVETLKRYKFSLAFENSNEEDYVTEKFFQCLVAGSVPVVIGAPNIQDFAPSSSSLLHIRELKDVDSVAKRMKYLAENPSVYNESLRWKFEGTSDSFKALIDMAAVHSSCRLCIYLATKIQEKDEENLPEFRKRPCNCTSDSRTTYHIYVRERGRFEMQSIFLRSDSLTLKALNSAVLWKFESMKHVPIWKSQRPESIRGPDELRIYRIYPVGMTQRQALYTFSFKGDSDFKNYIEHNPCPKFETIFV